MSRAPLHLGQFFSERCATSATSVGLIYRCGDVWVKQTYGEWLSQARRLCDALKDAGVAPSDRVLVISGTRVEWAWVMGAVMLRGAVLVPVHPSTPVDELTSLVRRTGPAFVFVDDVATLAHVWPALLPLSGRVALFESQCLVPAGGQSAMPFMRLADLGLDRNAVVMLSELKSSLAPRLADAEDTSSEFSEESTYVSDPESEAAILVTSGTERMPRAVVLSHSNLLYQARTLAYVMPVTRDDVELLLFPVSHILGSVCLLAAMVSETPVALGGGVRSLLEDLQTLRPTALLAAPGVLDKMCERVRSMVEELPSVWKEAVAWGLKTRSDEQLSAAEGNRPDWVSRLRLDLARRVVWPQFRDLFGGRVRFMVSGAAPLSSDTVRLMGSLGIPVLDVYGLTEASGATHMNRIESIRPGSVGQALPLVETRILGDGEVAIRCPGLMTGYLDDPEGTSERIQGGWLLTGDLGMLSADGYLSITGRKKSVIVTAAGVSVSPAKVEALLEEHPLVSRAVAVGDGREALVALLTLRPGKAQEWAATTGLAAAGLSEIARSHELHRELEVFLRGINGRLSVHERLVSFVVLDHQLTADAGELTLDGKLKRKVIEKNYSSIIDMLYKERY